MVIATVVSFGGGSKGRVERTVVGALASRRSLDRCRRIRLFLLRFPPRLVRILLFGRQVLPTLQAHEVKRVSAG
jgi:hypothetical protein